MIPCHRCYTLMERPFLMDADERELCERCANPPTLCCLCDGEAPKDDALPFPSAANPDAVAHFGCVGKLQRALGIERAATLIRKSGPAFRGRS